jgi:hypothetical protein
LIFIVSCYVDQTSLLQLRLVSKDLRNIIDRTELSWQIGRAIHGESKLIIFYRQRNALEKLRSAVKYQVPTSNDRMPTEFAKEVTLQSESEYVIICCY